MRSPCAWPASLISVAQRTGEEILLFAVAYLEAGIADSRGDNAERRRALLEALDHARHCGSDRSLAMVSNDLGELDVKAGNYAAALDYSTQALTLARKLHRPLVERLAGFSVGLAELGLGHPGSGKPAANSAIEQSLAESDLYTADEMMRRYRTALENVGDLQGALEVTHRDETVRDQLAVTARDKALLELSAKFDAERRARRIELLERDNDIKTRDLQAQRSHQQMILMSTALIGLACGALFWGIVRIRKINALLLHNLQHDALTGLLNRRYFNEHILSQQAERPYVGSLLLIAVDNTEHINDDAWGYAASDAVVRAVSQRLSSVLHDCDALVHWAGEVFLVMTGPMSDTQLNLAARRLLSAIRSAPVACNNQDIACTVSIGYAGFPLNGAAAAISLERAIALVDKALHQTRAQGGDRAGLITVVRADKGGELRDFDAQFELATGSAN